MSRLSTRRTAWCKLGWGLVAAAAVWAMPSLSAHAAIVNGLVNHWTFDDGTGSTTAADSVGGVTGNLVNMEPASDWVAGKIGSALVFDGVDEYVRTAGNVSYNRESFSMSLWFRTTSGADVKILNFFSANDHPIQIISGTTRACVGAGCVNAPPTITDNQWHHAVVTGAAGTNNIKLYLDGNPTPIGTLTSGAGIVTEPMNVAARVDGSGNRSFVFPGQVDDIGIWNRPLTANEVRDIYLAGAVDGRNLAQAQTPITGGTGPGGVGRTAVSSPLVLWLKADAITGLSDGQDVGTWANSVTHAGKAGDATVANTAPTFENAAGDLKNGNPVVNFSGRVDNSTGDVLSGTGTFTAEKTMFIVAQQRTVSPSSNCCQGGISTGIDANGLVPNGGGGNWSTDWAGAGTNVGSPDRIGNWAVVSGLYNNSTDPRTRIWVDGAGAYTNSQSTARGVAATDYRLGARRNDGDNLGRFLDGNIAEVVVYNGLLNDAERVIVENYLSSKWNVPLGANDFYSGDTPAAGDYDRDVFGVGRVNAANETRNSGAAGFGIFAPGLDDNQWVLAGHKVPVNSLTGADMQPTFLRWDRVWYVDATGRPDVTLGFDFSDGGLTPPAQGVYALLFSPTSAFNFTVLPVGATVSGDTVTFNLPGSLLNDGYYTLGIVPEPASLALLLVGAAFVAGNGRRRRRRPGDAAGRLR